MNFDGLTPLGARMIVIPDEYQHKGRIVIPDTAKRKTTTGRIIKMGDPPHEVLKVGDRVLFALFSGTPVGFETSAGEPDFIVRILSYDEVIARIDSEELKIKGDVQNN